MYNNELELLNLQHSYTKKRKSVDKIHLSLHINTLHINTRSKLNYVLRLRKLQGQSFFKRELINGTT